MRKSYVLLLAAALLAGCSKSDDVVTPQAGDEVIRLKSAVQEVSAESRAPYTGAISAANTLTARVLASQATGNYATLWADGTMTFNGAGTTTYDNLSAGSSKFPAGMSDEDTRLYFGGLYPAAAWTALDAATGTYSYTFTGKEDVMGAKEISNSGTQAKLDNINPFNFKHLLTKLEVKLEALTTAAPAIWGKVTRVELVGTGAADAIPHNRVTFSFATATALVAGGSAATFPFYAMSETAGVKAYSDAAIAPYTLTTTSTPVAYSLVAPITAVEADADFKFKVYTERVPSGTDVTVNLKKADGTPFSGSTSGCAFNILLKFKGEADGILADAIVIDWVEAGYGEAEIGE